MARSSKPSSIKPKALLAATGAVGVIGDTATGATGVLEQLEKRSVTAIMDNGYFKGQPPMGMDLIPRIIRVGQAIKRQTTQSSGHAASNNDDQIWVSFEDRWDVFGSRLRFLFWHGETPLQSIYEPAVTRRY